MNNNIAKHFRLSESTKEKIIKDYMVGKSNNFLFNKYKIERNNLLYILEESNIPTRNNIRYNKPPEWKICRICKQMKPIEEIRKHPQYKDGYSNYCKDCYRKRDRRHAKKNRRKSRFGITDKEYKKMLEEQNYVCAICGFEETTVDGFSNIRDLAIDHDHESGKVRGLLCLKCNTALGAFHDNIENLEKAIQYLKENS